jgi:formylglycine-generating enzyme required for sulfatase activity
MPQPAADRNLLFGILALQMDFITHDALIAAMHAWVLDKAKPLGQILLDRGALPADRHDLLEALVREHLKLHGHDPGQSLAALGPVGPVHRDLQGIADADLHASLAQVGSTRPDGGPEATGPHFPPGTLPPHARFQILRPHAKGGLGQVFVARDQELQREVALKEIQERHAENPKARARFLLEAEVTGGLEHPGIVPVYGLGHYADGRPFYAMRFVKGDSLQDAIARFHRDQGGRAPGERALALRGLLRRFVDVCNAMAYAHSRGVLHRDLKPGNVMLGPYGETLVVDWGLAKPLGRPEGDGGTAEAPLLPASGSGSAPTQAGQALGTPAFMSPEQAAGRLDQLGAASDVYSLGATLYALLTGKAPFEGADVGAVLRRVQRGEFPPPRQVGHAVPPALEAVCLKAMALRPPDRYGSARDLAGDVEKWLADEPVTAYREPWRIRLGRWRRRHPRLVTGAAALGLTALVALGVGYVLLAREQGRTRQAQRDRALAQVDALLDASPQAVPTILEGLEPFRAQVLPRLRELRDRPDPAGEQTAASRAVLRQHRTRASLALLAVDPGQVGYLRERLLAADVEPEEMLLLRAMLLPHREALAEGLWAEAGQAGVPPERRFRCLVALAGFAPQDARWDRAAGQVVEPLLGADPLHVGVWSGALHPVRAALLGPLTRAFRDRNRVVEGRVAAGVLQDYAPDQPELLADLLADADERQFAVLLPKLQAHGQAAVALLHRELERAVAPSWQDAALDPAWPAAPAGLVQEVEKADGMVAERFALCQTLPLERAGAVVEGLRRSGYRPLCYRPYAAAGAVRVAAVWTRDQVEWQMAQGLPAEALGQRDAAWRAKGLVPLDMAGYLVEGAGRGPEENYAALWVRKDANTVDAKMYAGVPETQHRTAGEPLQKDGYVPRTQTQVLRGGQPRYSAVWWKPVKPFDTNVYAVGRDEAWYEGNLTPSSLLVDVRLGQGPPDRRYSAAWHDSSTHESAESHGLDPVAHLVHRLTPLGVDVRVLARRLEVEADVSARRALILALGEFGPEQLPADLRQRLVPRLLGWYRSDPDPGIHAAVDWLLRHGREGPAPRPLDWRQGEALGRIDQDLARTGRAAELAGTARAVGFLGAPPDPGVLLAACTPVPVQPRPGTQPGWYVNGQGQTLAILPGPVEFLMGSPEHEPDRGPFEGLHHRRIERSFAIGTKPVTVEQFGRFRRAHREAFASYFRRYSPEGDGPVIVVTWYEAAQYCRWLSEQEGVPEGQMCYPPVAQIEKSKDGKTPLALPPDYLARTGYRLPTEAEWEYACRAGAATSRSYGSAGDLLPRYAWYLLNAEDRMWPVGQKRPNDLGLFDMHGHVWQWCQGGYAAYPPGGRGRPAADEEDKRDITDQLNRVLRGGSFDILPSSVRSAYRNGVRPAFRNVSVGLRVARTCR